GIRLRSTLRTFAVTAHKHLQLATGGYDDHDGARRLAVASQASENAQAICDSRRKAWPDCSRSCSRNHEPGRVVGKRQVWTAMGTRGAGGRAGGVLGFEADTWSANLRVDSKQRSHSAFEVSVHMAVKHPCADIVGHHVGNLGHHRI